MQGIMKPPQPFLNPPVCQTEIQLNGTHTMSGEQETPFLPLLPEYIYLGGAPHDMLHVRYFPQSTSALKNVQRDSDMVVPAPGLRGCILSLTLGEREVGGSPSPNIFARSTCSETQ